MRRDKCEPDGSRGGAGPPRPGPPLFETAAGTRNLYGRYRVVMDEFRRRAWVASYAYLGGALLLITSVSSKVTPTGGMGRLAAALAPAVPYMVAGLFIWLAPVGIRLFRESHYVKRYPRETSMDLRDHRPPSNVTLCRSDERRSARIEAFEDCLLVDEPTGEVLFAPIELGARHAVDGARGWSRMRMYYDEVTCVFVARDIVVVRFCWGEGIGETWDVIVDRSSFTAGTDGGFIRFLLKRVRGRRVSRDPRPKARLASRFADVGTYFRQRWVRVVHVPFGGTRRGPA